MVLPRADGRPSPDDPYCLVVEGGDDQGVCVHFVNRLNIRAYVQDERGYEALRKRLQTRIKSPGRRALGVVVDADESMLDRWQSLRDVVAPLGYALPERPDPVGTIAEAPNLPRLGIWLMPDNTLDGMLEHFVAFLVPPDDALYARAGAVLEAIPEADRRFKDIHHSKALIHTWLAWQEEPGRPMGQAITKRFLDDGCAEAIRFADWLKRLFG